MTVFLLGCTLAGNTLTSAISFSRPIARKRSELADGEDLIQALKFLERYEGARRLGFLDNSISNDLSDYGNEQEMLMPFVPSLPRNLVQGNELPPPPFALDDYPLEGPYGDPYDWGQMFNTEIDRPMGGDQRRMTIGDRIQENVDFNQLMNRLIEDAVMEEVLREDAQEAAETLRADLADEESSSYSVEPELNYSETSDDYGLDLPSYSIDIGDARLEELSDYSTSSEEDEEVDEELLEAVILRLAESELEQELSDEASGILEDNNTEMEPPVEEIIQEDLNTEVKIDNFISKIMAELVAGSESLADKLMNEIEEEKGILDEEAEDTEGSESSFEDVIFSNGWNSPSAESQQLVKREDSCPALDYILDDCSVVDDFPGLGDEGYKDGFGESCNRHQLCYFCSGTFDIPTKLCDDTYKMELMNICNEDPECDFRAKYFWLSALASRESTDSILPVCREACVVGYLLNY